MELIQSASPAATAAKPVKVSLPEVEVRQIEQPAAPALPKTRGYGLPCAKCRRYYAADLDTCPICNYRERVEPIVSPTVPKVQGSAEPLPNAAALEQEREEFLKQFKSQLIAAQAEAVHAASVCGLSERHAGGQEPAAICKPCYDQLQERLDVCEAALHIELKEAGQIVYDAVWADPSDPNKTYTNAANALLTELRKRAGISSLLGFQPLAH
jgi:hypothetical protein